MLPTDKISKIKIDHEYSFGYYVAMSNFEKFAPSRLSVIRNILRAMDIWEKYNSTIVSLDNIPSCAACHKFRWNYVTTISVDNPALDIPELSVAMYLFISNIL